MTPCILAPDADLFPLAPDDLALAESHGFEIREVSGHRPSDFAAHGSDAVASLVWSGWYGRSVYDALPNLKVLARCGAGFDNIDLREAQARGIAVTYCPGLLDDSVAEHTIAMMYALTHKLVESDRSIRGGRWLSQRELAPITSLTGATLGLVGFGRIARRVAQMGTALGMRVIAFDPYVAPLVGSPEVALVRTLAELLDRSDVVSLHMPLTDETRNLLDTEAFRLMKSSAFLVNTGRGGLVDSEALTTALLSHEIAGAALDVFDPEPIPADHQILTAPNTIFTPHSSGFESSAMAALRQRAIADAIAVLEGRQPEQLLDMERTGS